jgi:DNA primase
MLIGVTMRRTTTHLIKWLHQPSGIYMGNYIYNANNIKLGKPVMITEGCGDVWNAYQNGYDNVVAMFGAHMTDTQETILLSKAYELLLALDPDYAGIKAMQDIYNRLKHKMNIRFLNVPIKHDVGDLTKEKTLELLNNTLTYLKWLQLEHVDDIVNKNLNMKGWIKKWITD